MGPALALFLSCSAACVPLAAQAPFPARPDTVTPGDLFGPFAGQVLDQGSGNPVSGALVFGSWAFETAAGLRTPVLSQTAQAVTRSDGNYELPRIAAPSQPGILLRRFTLLIYKSGYAAWRSDLRTDDGTPRHDFAQQGMKIRLERLAEGESHARKLLFLGGGGALRRAAQGEIVLAALELSERFRKKEEPPRPEPPQRPPPGADALLLLPDVLEITGSKLRFTPEPLKETTDNGGLGPPLSSVHFKAAGRDESFDAALRLWHPRDGALAAYATLKKALPQPRDTGELGDAALRAYDPKRRIFGVVTALKDDGLVLQLSCGKGLCQKEETAARLLRRVADRLDEARRTPEKPPQKPTLFKVQP